ncbi:MAG: TolC family protein [Candidatus Eisenbacteria sp.]|nr:TolC family protein [Candidatus Eisenbacteria bacterium]
MSFGTKWGKSPCGVAAATFLSVAILGTAAWAGPDSSEPLSVDECVRLALENNHSLATAEATLDRSSGSAKAAMRAILPNLRGNASWRQDNYREAKGGRVVDGVLYGGSDVFYNARISVRLTESLLDMEGLTNWRSRKADFGAARWDVNATREDVEVSTREQFYACLAAIKLAEVEENAIVVGAEQLRRAETLFRLGSVARSDVLQAQVNLAESEMNAINRRNAVRVEHSRLALVMGLDPRVDLQIDTTLLIPSDDPGGDVESWISQALMNRPELVAARTRLRSAELAESATKLGRLPTIGVEGSWSRSATSRVDSYLRDVTAENNWTVGVGVSLTLFDGLSREGQIQSAVAEKRARQVALDRQEKETSLQVKDSFLSIRKERESLRAAQTSVRLAEENLRLQQALYDTGAGTLLEWDNARLDLRRARVFLVQAQINLVISHIRFQKAAGK